MFYFSFKADESWVKESGIDFSDKAQVLAWFKREYKSWDEIWLELFENAEEKFIPRPQYCMPLDQNWEALSSLTLIGDAAHLMPPFAGEGVNMAMQDALELSHYLNDENFPDIKTAIAAYEKQMRTRASEIAGITIESGVALHSPNAISFLVETIS